MNDLKEQTKNKLLDLSLNEKKLLITELSNRLFNDLDDKSYIQLTKVLDVFNKVVNLNTNTLILNSLIETNINLNSSKSNEKAELWKTKINNLFNKETKTESGEQTPEEIEYIKFLAHAKALFMTSDEFIDGLKALRTVKNYILDNINRIPEEYFYLHNIDDKDLTNLINVLSEYLIFEKD